MDLGLTYLLITRIGESEVSSNVVLLKPIGRQVCGDERGDE